MNKFMLTLCWVSSLALARSQSIEGYQMEAFLYSPNICYTETYAQKIRVVTDLDLETLTFLDKLKFKDRVYVRSQHEYLDAESNFVHDAMFESHENMFPKWYSHPYLIRTGAMGTKSYFNGKNEYLLDGWEGGHFSKTDHGEYVADSKEGGGYFVQEHSPMSQAAYDEVNKRVTEFGMLYKYVWRQPSAALLSQMQQAGYSVTSTNGEIKVANPDIEFTWNFPAKTTTQVYLEDGTVVRTIHTIYAHDVAIGNHLKTKEIVVIPSVFENGDCYEAIHTTVYSNYSTLCSISETALVAVQGNEPAGILIFPNPASDFLEVRLPCRECENVTITITDLKGSTMKVRRFESFAGQIAVGDLPPGMYILNATDEQGEHIVKFVKN